VKTVKHSDSVMVWGCFSAAGHGGLYFLPRNTTMNSEKYGAEPPHPFHAVTSHFPFPPRWDAVSCKQTHQDRQDKPFEVIDWPGNSPDFIS
jgi:hypothetical protein